MACDMAVEQIIESQKQPRLTQENTIRKDCLARMGEKPLCAEQVMKLLEEERLLFFMYSKI